MTKIRISEDAVEVEADGQDATYLASIARQLWDDSRPGPAPTIGFTAPALEPDRRTGEHAHA